MEPEELDAAGGFLLGERTHLDVDLVFRLENSFPPAHRLAEHLAGRYGFACSLLGARPEQPRWCAGAVSLPVLALSDGLTETSTSWLDLHGRAEEVIKVSGMVELRTGYPIDLSGEPEDTMAAFMAGRVPWLPAGPWFGAPITMGPALCEYNLLREVHLTLKAATGH